MDNINKTLFSKDKLTRGFFRSLAIILLFTLLPNYISATGMPPEDAVVFDGHSYKSFDMSMTWYDARQYSENLGGHLVTINSQAEQNFIQNNIQNGTKHFYWTGGYSPQRNVGVWEWVTGEVFQYDNWDSGQPDNYNDSEWYIAMIRNDYTFPDGWQITRGKWNDVSAHGDDGDSQLSRFGFIVEWDFIFTGCRNHEANSNHFVDEVNSTCTNTGLRIFNCVTCGEEVKREILQ